jgi:hypothetical protein
VGRSRHAQDLVLSESASQPCTLTHARTPAHPHTHTCTHQTTFPPLPISLSPHIASLRLSLACARCCAVNGGALRKLGWSIGGQTHDITHVGCGGWMSPHELAPLRLPLPTTPHSTLLACAVCSIVQHVRAIFFARECVLYWKVVGGILLSAPTC